MTLPPSDKALVPFVSVDHMMQLTHQIGLPNMLRGIADYIEADFLRWESFDKTPRVGSHSPGGVLELMPTSDGDAYGFKFVNCHPKNTEHGLQTVVAFGLLADVATGYPVLLSEMTLLTALRTAAMSALVARKLAPQDASVMAMIGNGAQSEFQALAMQEIVGIREVRLFDIDPKATQKCAANLARTGLTVTQCTRPEHAIEGAHILTTCTADKRNATILTGNMVGAGVHINAIGGDCPGKTEIATDVLHRSDIFVEFPPQTRVEGEIQQLSADHPVTELWQVLNGSKPGRTRNDQITLFDSVGFAVEDFSALRFVHDQIRASEFSVPLDMLADPDNPRDLFGMLQRAA